MQSFDKYRAKRQVCTITHKQHKIVPIFKTLPFNTFSYSQRYFVCTGCKQSICKETKAGKCAIWIPKTNNWTCRLCNSFTNGSNAACDWLLYQLNAKFTSNVSDTATNDVGLGAAAEVKQNETNEKIVWNKKGIL